MVSASPKETYRSEQSSSDDKWTYGLQERSKSAHKTYVNPILVTNSWTRRPENLKTAEISRQEAPSECRHLTYKFKMVKYLRDWIQHLWLASGLLHFLVTSSISMAPLQNVSSKKIIIQEGSDESLFGFLYQMPRPAPPDAQLYRGVPLKLGQIYDMLNNVKSWQDQWALLILSGVTGCNCQTLVMQFSVAFICFPV